MTYDFEYLKDIGAEAKTVELKRELDNAISNIGIIDNKIKNIAHDNVSSFTSLAMYSLEDQLIAYHGKKLRAELLLSDALQNEYKRKLAAEMIVDEDVAPRLNTICLQMQELIDMIAAHWSEYDKLCALIPTLEDCMHLLQDEYPEHLCENCM